MGRDSMSRIEKVNEAIKREISNMIQMGALSDPRVRFVTIMGVEVSKDLQHARVKFSTLSEDPKDIQDAAEGLDSCRGYVRKLISERVVMRYTPQFKFVYDKTVHLAEHIDKVLEEIKKINPSGEDVDEVI